MVEPRFGLPNLAESSLQPAQRVAVVNCLADTTATQRVTADPARPATNCSNDPVFAANRFYLIPRVRDLRDVACLAPRHFLVGIDAQHHVTHQEIAEQLDALLRVVNLENVDIPALWLVIQMKSAQLFSVR